MQVSEERAFQTERKQAQGYIKMGRTGETIYMKQEKDIIKKKIHQPSSSFQNRKAKKFSREIRRKLIEEISRKEGTKGQRDDIREKKVTNLKSRQEIQHPN